MFAYWLIFSSSVITLPRKSFNSSTEVISALLVRLIELLRNNQIPACFFARLRWSRTCDRCIVNVNVMRNFTKQSAQIFIVNYSLIFFIPQQGNKVGWWFCSKSQGTHQPDLCLAFQEPKFIAFHSEQWQVIFCSSIVAIIQNLFSNLNSLCL